MSETKRQTRKNLRRPDEFQTRSMQAAEWAQANSRTLYIVAGGLLAVLLIAAAATWIIQWRADRAADKFYAAAELFKREQWGEARASFEELSGSLGGTAYGRLASLYAGRAALKAGDSKAAIEDLRAFLAESSIDPSLAQLARLDLAAALESSGDTESARSELETALALDGPAKAPVMLRLARLEEARGQTQRALDLYQQYLKDVPTGAERELARTRIIALGGTPPASAVPALPNLQVQ